MKHVLVTGGAGYIGSHACKLLSRQGYIPITFDSLVTGWASAVKFGPFVQGDLLDRDALDAAGVTYAMFQPPGTVHGFNNDTTPRYDAEAAAQAWSRLLDLFDRRLRH